MADTAEAQLGRILYIIAAARQEPGIAVDELAQRLGVSPRTVWNDITAVWTKEYTHSPGSVADVNILVDSRGRVTVPGGGNVQRPLRLSPAEAGALGLALRVRAQEADEAYRKELLELATALEHALTAPPPKTHQNPETPLTPAEARKKFEAHLKGPDPRPSPLVTALAIDPGEGVDAGIRLRVESAAAHRRPLRILYLKPGDPAPMERGLHPYALISSRGDWYAVGHSPERNDIRAFRLDRILSADFSKGTFETPADFDPKAYTTGNLPYRSESDMEVAVRYSARVAPWVREQNGGQPLPDGSVLVRLRVADERWLVREVLKYGGEAVVVEPEGMRVKVAEAAERLAALGGVAAR